MKRKYRQLHNNTITQRWHSRNKFTSFTLAVSNSESGIKSSKTRTSFKMIINFLEHFGNYDLWSGFYVQIMAFSQRIVSRGGSSVI